MQQIRRADRPFFGALGWAIFKSGGGYDEVNTQMLVWEPENGPITLMPIRC